MSTLRWRGLIGLSLLLISGPLLALGLGEIRVKSGPGQPLVAEIPVISSEPGELEQLRAGLASPATFERVGLPRPQGVVSDLDFAVALDDAGRPIIRVTSRAAVDVPTLNFLVSVDWGQGRLVREYAVTLDAPTTVAGTAQPYIDAPQSAPDDAIIWPNELNRAEAVPSEASAALSPVTPVPPRAAPASSAPITAVAGAGDRYTVRRGQTLSQIARQVAGPHSLDQTMISLLRANPDAFIRGNINQLRQGAVLRVPVSEDIARLSESEAEALVRGQVDDWRQARRPIPQPAAMAAAATSSGATAQVASARLEIAPPLASAATRAGTQSGIDAGGEGNMLANEQLQQTREDLAARDSEVQELRAQVAELEKLKQQQTKLIAMKDSDLAAAQQRLAQSNGSDAGMPVWAWTGWVLLMLGALAWWLLNRRRRVVPAPAPRSRVLGNPEPVKPASVDPLRAPVAPVAVDTPVPAPEVRAPLPDAVKPAATAKPSEHMPTWHAAGGVVAAPLRVALPEASSVGRDRLELAIAYLDLGDIVTARDLLNEVAAGNDDGARQQALQLLREIG